MSKAKITAIGTYAPSRRLTNADLEKIVDTSDEWIDRYKFFNELHRFTYGRHRAFLLLFST